MNHKFTLDKSRSAELCQRLEVQLGAIFSGRKIRRYLIIDGYGPELKILNDHNDVQSLPHIKLAFSIWSGMNARDRHNVLYRFQQLYATLPTVDQRNRKTLVFCALFVNEFAATLADAMEWPDRDRSWFFN